MSKRSARTFEDEQQDLIAVITSSRVDVLKCEDCEWGIFAGECKEYVKGGHCADFAASFAAYDREYGKAEDEVHAGRWVIEKNLPIDRTGRAQ